MIMTLTEIIVMGGILLIGIYIASYCCMYTSVVISSALNAVNVDAEIRSKDMTGTPYMHLYTHALGYDLFLNPFRGYSESYKVYTVDEMKQNKDWGHLFNPFSGEFI